MYSVICLFPWLPVNYNFYVAVMRVFKISDTQIVCLRIQRSDNLIIFSVVSEEVFDRLSEFFCRILHFPLVGLNILECFVYPESPQFQFYRISAYPDEDTAETLNGYLSMIGTVLYQRRLSFSDSIGVVLHRMDRIKIESNDSAVLAIAPLDSQSCPGNCQENQIAVSAVPDMPVAGPSNGGTAYRVSPDRTAVGLQQLISNPERHNYFGNMRIKSEFPYQIPGPKIGAFEARERGTYGRNFRRHRGRYSQRNHSSTIGRSSPSQEPVKEEREAQGSSSEDEYLSDAITVKEEYPESSSDEVEKNEGL